MSTMGRKKVVSKILEAPYDFTDTKYKKPHDENSDTKNQSQMWVICFYRVYPWRKPRHLSEALLIIRIIINQRLPFIESFVNREFQPPRVIYQLLVFLSAFYERDSS